MAGSSSTTNMRSIALTSVVCFIIGNRQEDVKERPQEQIIHFSYSFPVCSGGKERWYVIFGGLPDCQSAPYAV